MMMYLIWVIYHKFKENQDLLNSHMFLEYLEQKKKIQKKNKILWKK